MAGARLRQGNGDSCGVRTHAQLPAVHLKSTPLATRANCPDDSGVAECTQRQISSLRAHGSTTCLAEAGAPAGAGIIHDILPRHSQETTADLRTPVCAIRFAVMALVGR